jgi:hypothetical protein
LTTTFCATGLSLYSQASNSGARHFSEGSSHSPSEKMIDGE